MNFKHVMTVVGLLAATLVGAGCSNQHEGMHVDSPGRAPDNDRDGITDDVDQCLDTRVGHPVDASGCSVDLDGDGVVNSRDECPGTPEGVSVDRSGCALDTDASPTASLPTLRGMHFRVDSAELTEAAAPVIAEVLEALEDRPGAELQVIGHTDSTGSARYNLDLAMRRAEAVVERLQTEGIAAGRLSALARGQTAPVASNDTDQGRARNRRVELILGE